MAKEAVARGSRLAKAARQPNHARATLGSRVGQGRGGAGTGSPAARSRILEARRASVDIGHRSRFERGPPSAILCTASGERRLRPASSSAAVLGILLGERSGKRGDCRPMLWNRDIQVVAGEINEHTLLG